MTDRPESRLAGADGPRPLPADLRARLETVLLEAGAASVPLTTELAGRLEEELIAAAPADPVASALAGIDGPRPLPEDLAGRLGASLVSAPARPRLPRWAVALAAAASVVLGVGTAGVLVHHDGPGGGPVASSATSAPSPTASPRAGRGGDATTGPNRVTSPVPTLAGPGPGRAPVTTAPQPGPAVGGPVPPSSSGTVPGGGTGEGTATGNTAGDSSAYPGGAAGVPGASTAGGATTTTAPPHPPVVSSVSPRQGPVSGGTAVTITGQWLSQVTSVRFGDTACTRFTVVSAGEIRALSPPHSAALVDVTVANGGGTSPPVTADRFLYAA